MHLLHLVRADHLWVLQVAQEVLHLVGEEAIGLDTTLFFLLLLDLQTVDLVADVLLQVIDLPGHALVEDHDVLQQIELHLRLLPLKLEDGAPNRVRLIGGS